MGNRVSFDFIDDLKGKIAIVTGSNAGIGFVAARELCRKGCHVILACRSREKTQGKIDIIVGELGEDARARLEFGELDLSSLASVLAFVERYKTAHERLDILINNAGVMMCPYALSVDGVEMQFATNHMGHYLLTMKLLGCLEAAAPSRVVNLSSSAHQSPFYKHKTFPTLADINDPAKYSAVGNYGITKAANVLFTKFLAEKVADKQIFVNAAHPGYVDTELVRHASDMYTGMSAVTWLGSKLIAKTPEQGAYTELYLAGSREVVDKNLRGIYLPPYSEMYFSPTPLPQPCNPLCDDPAQVKQLIDVSNEILAKHNISI